MPVCLYVLTVVKDDGLPMWVWILTAACILLLMTLLAYTIDWLCSSTKQASEEEPEAPTEKAMCKTDQDPAKEDSILAVRMKFSIA